MRYLLLFLIMVLNLYASSFDMSLSQCVNLSTELKQAVADKNYNKIMDIGGIIFLGCDKHLSVREMDILLKTIDNAEKKSKT